MESNDGKKTQVNEDIWLNSICNMCFNTCGIKVHRVNGTVVKIEGDPNNPQNLGRLCSKGQAAIMSLYDPYRLTKPLKRTNPEKGIGVDPKWVEISWDEALDTVVERLKKVRADNPKKLVLISFDVTMYAGSIVPAFLSVFGSPNYFAGSSAIFCGNVSHPVSYLTQAAIEIDPDLDLCNYCMLFGNQTGFIVNREGPSMSTRMADARARGMKLVVIDPVGVTNASAKADEWLSIRPGTDGALAIAMLHVLLNELGIYDRPFLKNKTNGPYLIKSDGRYLREVVSGKPLVWDAADNRAKTYDDSSLKDPALEGAYTINGVEVRPAFELLRDQVRKFSPEKAAAVTTIPAETIRRVAREFGEAARIGSTIMIDGVELPYRPVAVDFGRGSLAHKHAMLAGMAIQLLNVVVGAIDVPGGSMACNCAGPLGGPYYGQKWFPQAGPDGLIVPELLAFPPSFPARPVKRPETPELLDLFPVASISFPLLMLNMQNPEKFNAANPPEVLLHCRTNMMVTGGQPEAMANMLKKIPFMMSFAHEMDETVEFADIVIPEAHEMERLDPFPNHPIRQQTGAGAYWYWEVRQPVSDPPPNVRHWAEIVLEIADRMGLRGDMNIAINALQSLRDEYKLEQGEKYSFEEIGNRVGKSMLGPEYGLDWFKENGCIKWRKTPQEAYPGPSIKGRVPIYLEHFLDAGEEVKRVTTEMGLDWDTSDYQPLPDWKPCPAYEDSSNGYDLYAVNYKVPFHTFAVTLENPWLDDLCQHHPSAYQVVISTQAAARKGIQTGDEVWIEANTGQKLRGKVRVSECIHPEVVGFAGAFGRWAKGQPIAQGKGLHFNDMLPFTMDRIDMVCTALDACVKVKVYK